MCLAVPAKILKIQENEMALAEIGGIQKRISISLLEKVSEGDYVIVHVGYALSILDPEEAQKTLALFQELEGEAFHD